MLTTVAQSPRMGLEIRTDDPRSEDVRALLAIHLAFSRTVTPAEYSFALDVDELVDRDVTFFSARRDGEVVGVAALKRLNETHAELKSMHTLAAERRRGIGRALVEHVLLFARDHAYERVSLETGATKEFVAARALYERAGFRPCDPFGEYSASPYNTFMTIRLHPAQRASGHRGRTKT
jgi:putative acetyltransferase